MLLYTLISYYLAFAFVLVHFFVAFPAIFLMAKIWQEMDLF